MIRHALASRGVLVAAIGTAAMLVGSAAAQAALIEVQFSGVNIVYNGSSIVDAGSASGGVLDPVDADPLNTMTFLSNGTPVGTILGNISLDVLIPDVTGLLATPGNTQTIVALGTTPGYLDLLIGTSPLATQYLTVNLTSVSVTYIDASSSIQFAFAGGTGSLGATVLPFGLSAADPVTVSFSVQIDPGSLTSAGGLITGFTASGTGEVRAIPEPAALAPLALAGLMLGRRRR